MAITPKMASNDDSISNWKDFRDKKWLESHKFQSPDILCLLPVDRNHGSEHYQEISSGGSKTSSSGSIPSQERWQASLHEREER
jgi:hypothetical protein